MAPGCRDKWEVKASPETVAGDVLCLWEIAQLSRVCRGAVCVLDHPEGSRLRLLSEMEVWVQFAFH